MTVQDQRNQMIKDLAKIVEWQRIYEINQIEKRDDNDNDHKAIIKLLKEQNGRVRVNTGRINWIIGIGVGVSFVLGLGVFLI